MNKLYRWISCVVVVLSVVYFWAAWPGNKIDGKTTWMIALPLGTILWAISCEISRRSRFRNRYCFRTRVMRWLKQQFPLVLQG